MSFLLVNLLGPYQVMLDGEPLTGFDSDKVRALLAYLATESNRPHRREALAGLLWPESTEKGARTNLRRALANMRQIIGDRDASQPLLEVTQQTIQFDRAGDHRLDVTAFSELATGTGSTQAMVDQLKQAVSLYRGPFLEGFSLADSPAFEQWQMVKRETLEREMVEVLGRLADYYDQPGLFNQGLAYARQRVDLAPWDEVGHRQVIRLLARSGRRSEALAHYDLCRHALESELDVTPDAQTEALARRIRNGELGQESIQQMAPAVQGFELRERLGEGSFGVVYRAYQAAVKRDVAIKIIRPEFADQPDFIRRFDVEAQLAARLEHPHIVPLYDYWRDPNGAYLVMRWLKGGSLDSSLNRGPWSAKAAADLLNQIASALDIAHLRGVIHRDIKPANILLDEEGNAYLSDFGIATLAEAVTLGGITTPLTDISAAPGSSSNLTGSPEYISPEQVRQEPLTPTSDIYCLGIVLFVLLTGEHPFLDSTVEELPAKHLAEPLPLVSKWRSDLPAAVDRVIQTATAKEPGGRYANATALAADFSEATMQDTAEAGPAASEPAKLTSNPYKGLRPFLEADAGEFFGRGELVKRLLDRLSKPENTRPEEQLASDGTGRLLVIVGPSGSGKSSVVKAGLVPALRQGALPGSDKWFIVDMAPGSHPYQELEAALRKIAVKPPVDLWQQMRQGEQGLLKAIHQSLPEADSQLLLIIDQFEELFTLNDDKEERESFLDAICAAVSNHQGRVRLVITLRADYYDRPLRHLGLGNLIRNNTEVLLPLTPEEVLQAISGPAERAGLTVDADLIPVIRRDIRQEPGGLPLLQYALTELFDLRLNQTLTLAAYDEIGGLAGAIAQRAEALYQALNAEKQEASRQLFLRLVTVGTGPGNGKGTADTRRRVLRENLVTLSQDMAGIIDAFGSARLLTFDRDPSSRAPTVEIAHEALFREWPRLKAWVGASQEDLRQHQRLATAATEWQDAGLNPGFLLQGARLERFAGWSATTDLRLSLLESRYIEASQIKSQKRRAAEEARKAKERSLERRSRNQRIALVIAVAVVLLVGALGVAIMVGNLAEGVERAVSSVLQPDLLAEQPTREASLLAHSFLSVPQGRGVAYNPLSGELAISGQDAIATVRDPEYGQVIFELLGHKDRVNNLAYSLDGNYLATTSLDGTVKIWDAGSGELLRSVTGSQSELISPALSPDGSLLAATSFNATSQRLTTSVWDTATGERLQLMGYGDQVGGLAFSHDGAMLAVPGEAGRVIIWDPLSGEQLLSMREDEAITTDLAFSPDGRKLATSNSDGTAHIWDLASREIVITLRGHNGPVYGIAFSPDGRLVATGGADGTVRVWVADNGRELFAFFGHDDIVLNVSFSPDGRRLASGGEDNTTIIWDLGH